MGATKISVEAYNLDSGLTVVPPWWRKLALLLLHRRGVVGASLLVAFVLGGIYLSIAPRTIQTVSTVHVDVLDQLLPDSAATASNVLAVQPGIMRSTAVVALALASQDIQNLPLVQSDNGSISAIQSRLFVDSGLQAGDFEISLVSGRPADAEKLLNALVDAYINLETTQRVESSGALTSDLTLQQKKTALDLEAAKRQLDDALKRQSDLEPDPESRRLYAQQRAEAAAVLSDARQKADDAREPYEKAIKFFGDEDKLNQSAFAVFSEPDASSDADPEALYNRILQLQSTGGQRNQAGNRQAQLTRLKGEYAVAARDRYQAAIAALGDAQSRFDQLEKRTQDIDALDDEAARLQIAVDHLTASNAELTDRLSHSEVAAESRVAIKVLQPAQAQETPVWPRPLPVLGIVLLAGLLVGGVLGAAMDRLDTRVRDSADAVASAEAPILAQLPATPPDLMSLEQCGQCVLLKPSDASSLAYESLQAALEGAMTPGADRTILIASPTESRGTSVLASNLAILMARSGKRVALVDTRHALRAINEIFGIDDQIGLSDAISGKMKVAAALHVTGLEGLEILPVGSPEANWAELLNRPEFFQVLTELSERFDRVIIDGGYARSNECRIVSAFCDVTLLLADARKVQRGELRAAAEALRAVGANIPGIALKGLGAPRGSAWEPRFKGELRAPSNSNGEHADDAPFPFSRDHSGLSSSPASVEQGFED